MKIGEIINALQELAPPAYQENYDNASLLTGHPSWNCTGVLCTLDATEEVILEALGQGCNLVVAHHPIIFGGLKRINGDHYVEKSIITAIKNDIAIYAIHTNLDNIIDGVNGRMAELLQLKNCRALLPRPGTLRKLYTFVPQAQAEAVRDALFEAGAGQIGQYSHCSFSVGGQGSFKGGENTNPFAGTPGRLHLEAETRLELIFPAVNEGRVIAALLAAHPYEEVAYDIVKLENTHPGIGAGLLGRLENPMPETEFLALLKTVFGPAVIRHSPLGNRPVQTVALCGGAGSFLITNALRAKADVFVTADMKYHEFFEANGQMLIADIGHFESEQFTPDLLAGVLREKFPTFAVRKSGVKTNPVNYF